jgi:outer membrane lipoprotein carrier protein
VRRITTVCLCLLLSTGITLPAYSDNHADSEAAEARSLLLGFIASVDSYHADFEQTLEDEDGEVLEQAAGEFWLSRPGKFRWHYAPPMERLLISDGQKIWLHDVDLEQVTVRSASGALEQTPAGILVGNAAALDGYELSIRSRGDGFTAVGLRPREGATDFLDIVIAVATDGGLHSLSLDDRFGRQTVIRFFDQTLNPAMDSELFTFVAPSDADIIDQTLARPANDLAD